MLPLNPRIEPPPVQTGFLLLDCILSRRWDALADAFHHLVLPALVLGAYSMGMITRIMRSSMLEVLRQDYIRTAHAKGLGLWGVVMHHAFRNAALPVLTAIGLAFGNLMAGAVMTETVFAWPGIGRYAVESAAKVDFAPLMGVTIIVALIYVAINLVVDLLYAVLDPRIRLG